MSKKALDITGRRFGRLVAVDRVIGHRHPTWICRCDCGRMKPILSSSLTRGVTVSCGCFFSERLSRRNTTHGHAKKGERSRAYEAWAGMIARCRNPESTGYKNYGGRGISVCHSWLRFENFRDDMGECPKDKSLERNDVNGNYEPGNCRWATKFEQDSNRRNTRVVSAFGESKPLFHWCKERGLDYLLVFRRLRRGWSAERALTEPAETRGVQVQSPAVRCDNCGTTFKKRASQIGRTKHNYCSRFCSGQAKTFGLQEAG